MLGAGPQGLGPWETPPEAEVLGHVDQELNINVENVTKEIREIRDKERSTNYCLEGKLEDLSQEAAGNDNRTHRS